MDCMKEPLATEMLKCLTDELHRSHLYLTISALLNVIFAIAIMLLMF